MSEQLTVTIQAKDNVSKVFTAISASATKTGDAVERAGKDGAAGLKQMDSAAKTSGKSMDDLKNRATAVGAAIGVLGGVIIALGTSYRDQERQIDGITRLYGDQSAAVLQMSDDIQDLTRYSNDAARESFLLASSLVGNYQLSTEHLDLLIERSADLAQIYGFTLPDAVQRTSSALRGEGESAERLGLNMSDAAIAARALDAGITNWNVPGALSEAEKAAFRFTVFLEQTESTVGAAGEAADSAGGNFRQFANTMQDAGQSVGGFLGPIGEVGAEMAPIAIALPVVAAGLGRMSAALRGTAIAGRAASLGVGALSLLTSPLALGLGAVALAGVGVYKNWDKITNIFASSSLGAMDLAESTANLNATLQEMQVVFNDIAAAKQFEGAMSDMTLAFDTYIRNFNEGMDLLAHEDGPSGWIWDSLLVEHGSEQLAHMAASSRELFDELNLIEEEMADVGTALNALGPMFTNAALDGEKLSSTIRRLFDEFARTGDAQALEDSLEWINDHQAWYLYAESLTVAEIAVRNLTSAQTEWQSLGAGSIGESTEQMQQYQLATQATTEALEEQFSIIGGQNLYGQVSAQKAANVEYAALLENIVAFEDATQTFLENGDNILDFWLQYQTMARESNDAALEFNEGLEKGAAGLPIVLDVATDAFRELVASARDLDEAGEALDRILTVFGQIDSLGQRSSAAGSIADTLIGSVADNLAGAEAAIGTLEDLWSRVTAGTSDAALTQDTYNQALTAGNQIQQSNLRVQDDLTAMRAAQLPLLAQEQSAYEAMIAELSVLPALEQRRALALQDSGVQAQIATQYATAYSATLGEIPTEVASNMIISSANADPVIRDLLLNMGLIEEGADGELRVHFPDGDTVQDSIMMLTESIDQLTIAMGGVPPLRVEADTAEAEESLMDFIHRVGNSDGSTIEISVGMDEAAESTVMDFVNRVGGIADTAVTVTATADTSSALNSFGELVGRLTEVHGQSATVLAYGNNSNALNSIAGASGALGDLDGNVATTYANTVDNASGILGNVSSMLTNLNGRTVTTYVNTVYRGTNVGVQGYREMHGGIPGYASGGTVIPIWAGEAGPEIAHFAGGGSAWLPREGAYAVPPGTYIEPANSARGEMGGVALAVNIYGNVYGMDDLTEQVTRQLVPTLADELRRHRIAAGVAA
jgi:hypothetical protein